jgi:hypothetical protein
LLRMPRDGRNQNTSIRNAGLTIRTKLLLRTGKHRSIRAGHLVGVEACELTSSWLGDKQLALMDVNTENADVQQVLQNWIGDYVKEFGIDGLRIDGEH